MKRFFTLMLGALAMVAVALISAFIAMRLAIHGREVQVPTLTGLTVARAASLARHDGLELTLEDRFYSATVPAGHILQQYPAAGSRVRREWEMRVTESLGPQRVTIPDLTRQSERAAMINLRRLALEPGAVALFAVSGDPGIVLTQTPQPNAGSVDSPRVSLLVSDPSAVQPDAYVMPYLVGLPLAEARARTSSAGLLLVASEAPASSAPASNPAATASGPASAIAQRSTVPSAVPTFTPAQSRLLGLIPTPPPRPTPTVIIAQSPPAGYRVVTGDTVRVTLGHPAPSATSPTTPSP